MRFAGNSLIYSYKGLDDVVAFIFLRGDAYQAVAIHPAEHQRQGLRCKLDSDIHFSYYFDNRLSSSHYICSKMSDFIVRCMVGWAGF